MIYCDMDFEKWIRKEHFDYLNNLPPIARFTEKFRLQLESLPVHLLEGDRIFGWFGHDEKLPEMEMPVFDDSIRSDELQKLLYIQAESGSTTYVDKSHVCADYKRIIERGLVSYEEEIDQELEKKPDSEYLLAMKNTLASVRCFSRRLGQVAGEAAAKAEGADRQRLLTLKAAAEKVPYYPADTFLEAIQSIWIVHFLIPMAEYGGWCSVSVGPMDKYLYPYYRKALDSGMSRDEIKAILRNFWQLLNSYSDAACLMNVGGREYNELSELLIECQKEFAMPAPILGARIDENTPPAIWEQLIDEDLFAMGQPTFYSEPGCIRALTEKGVPADEAVNFTNNSCMAIGMAGQEVNSMWGTVFYACSSLEAAMNEGRILFRKSEQVVPDIGPVTDEETLFQNFERCAAFWLDRCVSSYEGKVKWYAEKEPDVFLSIITEGSIQGHQDRLLTARYHNVTVECMGMINVADSICAISELVFRQKKYTVAQLNDAIVTNFRDCPEIREDMLKCPKFGKEPVATAYAVRVADILQKLIRSHDHGHYRYSPSLHTLDSNVKYGSRWGAGYDGRQVGDPFAKNAGPSNIARASDPTSVILATARLPQHQFYGGQPLDIHFQVDTVKHHKQKVAALIKTYLLNGGLQFQVNALSSAVLREAVAKPEQYEHLVVRIGGYSCYFNSLTAASKEEFIQRFEIEEK